MTLRDLPKDSLADILAHPFRERRDLSALPLQALATQAKAYVSKHSNPRPAPETDALAFYGLSHVLHLLSAHRPALAPLPPDEAKLARTCMRRLGDVGLRLFFYSAVIAVEEARFMPSQDEGFFSLLEQSFGPDFEKWSRGNYRTGQLADFGDLGKKGLTVGDYARGMVSTFAFARWQPGFGGRGWVPIASLLSDCVHGKISLEGFADQAFSLCHNNGSMFNKGHLYGMYSPFIYEILDLQDAGQIPAWIATNETNRLLDPELKAVFQQARALFPAELAGPVDTSKVKDSSKRREKKQAHQKAWMSAAHTPPPPKIPGEKGLKEQQNLNNLLMGGLK